MSKSVYAPLHLFGALVRHKAGQNLLRKKKVIFFLLNDLYHFLSFFWNFEVNDSMNDLCCLTAKAALFSLGQIIGNITEGILKFKYIFLIFLAKIVENIQLPTQAIALISYFAEECDWLEVRGTAFWALNMAGCSAYGAEKLAELGWESVRNSWHIQKTQKNYRKNINRSVIQLFLATKQVVKPYFLH